MGFAALQVFSELDKQQIANITNILDDSIVKERFSKSKIKEITDMGFTTKQAHDIIECYYNFYIGSQNPTGIQSIVNRQTNLTNKTKQQILELIDVVHKKADKQKINLEMECNEMQKFGHPHIFGLKSTLEFRPIIIKNKLEKMTVSTIIHFDTHDEGETSLTPLVFQTSTSNFKKIIQALNEQLTETEIVTQALSKKLGDDFIVD